MELEKDFEDKRNRINQRLDELIPKSSLPYQNLFDAAKYSLNSSGKRLRPLLTLAAVEMLGGKECDALTPACAIEFVHTYSLIHDDLPCMDNDDFRRGKPTLHKVFPEGVAVLAGDFLLTHAFQLISSCQTLSDTQKIKLISVLATNAGGDGMIAGQIMDMKAENTKISFEELQMIHTKKTGALIAASLEFGAILASANSHLRETLKSYGEIIGLAFQITDDLLDVTHSQAKHGKSVSSDIINNKSTYASILGAEKAKMAALELAKKAKEKLQSLSYNTNKLEKIADYIISRTN